MANYSKEKLDSIWEKGKIVESQDSSIHRQDFAGAWMEKSRYGQEHPFGWEVDHKIPESKGGTNDISNLQPVQWENNRAKGGSYPSFHSVASSNGSKYIKKTQRWKVEKTNTTDQ